MNYHVKGDLFLTGDQWSSSQREDDRGHPTARVWYFDFLTVYEKTTIRPCSSISGEASPTRCVCAVPENDATCSSLLRG